MKPGSARGQVPTAWRLVDIKADPKRASFTYQSIAGSSLPHGDAKTSARESSGNLPGKIRAAGDFGLWPAVGIGFTISAPARFRQRTPSRRS